MNKKEIDDYMKLLSDTDLIRLTKTAHADLKKAAKEQPNSEWHEACFAGLYCFSCEMGRRRLRIS